ncbi:PH domain-containing protein [Jatrophihabitans fulvus]
MSDTGSDTGTVVEARPVKTARIANASAAVALIVFVLVAIFMKDANAGAYFAESDQIFTVILGLIVAGGLRLPARPRMRADATGVHSKSYLGSYRFIPWEAVVAVEFPKSVRFAQLRLPGNERLAIYAVQRMDGEYAVDTMRKLRALHAASRPPEPGTD